MSAISYFSKRISVLRAVTFTVSSHRKKALRRSLTATSACSSDFDPIAQHNNPNESRHTLLFGGVAAVFIGCATFTDNSKFEANRRTSYPSLSLAKSTFCEAETATTTDDSDDAPGPHNDFGAVPVENDPYATLPAVDEETTCEICNTFRKGPCRKYWRKTERCWKDGDTDKCTPYSTPFIHCSQYYRNLYLLIMLNNFQEYVTAMELDTKTVEIRQFADENRLNDNNSTGSVPYVNIDWNPWQEFNKDFGLSFSQTIPSNNANPKPPFWKRLPEETEPILVPCNVKIPTQFISSQDDNKLMHLQIAYVTDQDGFVIGKYFKPSKKSDESDESVNDGETKVDASSENNSESTTPNSESSSMESDTVAGNHKDEDDDIHAAEISCILLPGEMKSIVVTALYSEINQIDFSIDNESEEEEEACVYKKEYDLYNMAS